MCMVKVSECVCVCKYVCVFYRVEQSTPQTVPLCSLRNLVSMRINLLKAECSFRGILVSYLSGFRTSRTSELLSTHSFFLCFVLIINLYFSVFSFSDILLSSLPVPVPHSSFLSLCSSSFKVIKGHGC